MKYFSNKYKAKNSLSNFGVNNCREQNICCKYTQTGLIYAVCCSNSFKHIF